MYNTAHPHLEMKDAAGTVHSIEYRQFVLNDKQQFAILGINRDLVPIEVANVPGLLYQFLGKLEEQNTVFSMQIKNSLMLQQWDFDAWPDPEILLITKE